MEFINELGNTIKLHVSKKDIEGVDGVLMHIEGPTSDTDVHITRKEAEVLYEELGKILDEV